MKINATQTQVAAIVAALQSIHIYPFQHQQSDAKYDAQRNLSGKSHYYEDSTLKYHHSRVLAPLILADGLLFAAITSEALDMRNTRRGFRFVVHDLFGTCVTRPDLENAFATHKAARKALDNETFDVVAHYQAAIARRLKETADQAAELETTLAALPA